MNVRKIDKIALLVFLFAAFAIFLFGYFLISQNQQESGDFPFPTKTPDPTKKLQVKQTVLSQQELQELSIVSPISFTFSNPVNITTMKYSITPKENIYFQLDEKKTTVSFKPADFWK